MTIKNILFIFSTIAFSLGTNADLCDELFTYQDGQVMNRIDKRKARIISQLELWPESRAEGAIKRQLIKAVSEFRIQQDNDLENALAETDDNSAIITIAQSKKTRKLYTIVQFFRGDTEVGNVFSLYSSRQLAELGDGDCR